MNIKAVRERRGLTQKALAENAKLTQATISYLENGNKSPTERTLKKLATALDVDIMELIQVENKATGS